MKKFLITSRVKIGVFTVAAYFIGSAGLHAVEPAPFASPYLNVVDATHQVRILDDDTVALENVLAMISRARKSIEMEYFVFNPDRAGRLVLQELVKKASEGVQVRILVDYNANGLKPGLDSFYHDELARHGIALRYFNVADLIEFWRVGFRNHRKLLVVDDAEMVMGGRNIADNYFGMNRKMDYLDRDIWVKGPVVSCALDGFNRFWTNAIVENPRPPDRPVLRRSNNANTSASISRKAQDDIFYKERLRAFQERITSTRSNLVPSVADSALRERVEQVGGEALGRSPVVQIHSISLVSDTPVPGRSVRMVTPYLDDRIREAKTSIVMENFMFIPKGAEKHLLLDLLERGVKIDLLTNGFESDRNGLMAEIAHSRQTMGVHHGMNVYCYCCASAKVRLFSGDEAVWGLHTKTMVIDGKDTVIGSYNLDPRSAWINDEGTVVVNDNPQIAKIVADQTWARIQSATRLNQDGSYVDGTHCFSLLRDLTVLLRPVVEVITDQL